MKILQAIAVSLLFGAIRGTAIQNPGSNPDPNAGLTDEQSRVLEDARALGLQYTQNLPNFICTQITHRTATPDSTFGTSFNGATSSRGGSGMQRSSRGTNDLIEERLTFFNQFEHYEVVAVNNRKITGQDHLQFAGAISAGEFGSSLRNLFDPRTGATFSWDKATRESGHSVDVFKFRVPSKNGTIVVDRDTDRKIFAAYTGRLFVDCATHEAVRMSSELELPVDFPIKMATIAMDYKSVEIAGKRYSLPSHSEVRMKDSSRLYVNEIEFRNYHKFGAESTIHYDGDAARPQQ